MSQTRKKRSVWKTILAVLLCLILVVGGLSAYLLRHYAGLPGDLRKDEIGTAYTSPDGEEGDDQQVTATTNIADDVFTILLIGVDSRKNTYTGRSDSQMMISINQKQKKLVIASILRDCYVTIPGQGNNRINAAYA